MPPHDAPRDTHEVMGREGALPWFKCYPGDWLREIQGLSNEALAVWILFLLYLWENPTGISDDDAQLARIAHLSLKRWLKVRPELEAKSNREHGRWTCPFLEKYRDEARKNIEANKKRSQKGSTARWHGKEQPIENTQIPSASSNAQALLKHCQSEPEPEPESTPSKKEARDRLQANKQPSDGWLPSADDITSLRAGCPDLIGSTYDGRMAEWSRWSCRPDFTTTNMSAAWRTFMLGEPSRTGAGSIRPLNSAASGLPPELPWLQRMMGYKPGGLWLPSWGPRPESGQCHVPKVLLETWRTGSP